MQQFKISEAGHKKAKKRLFFIMIPMVVIVVLVIAVTNLTQTNAANDINTLPFVLPVILVIFGFNLFRSYKKQNKFLDSYTITLSDEGIRREQFNTQTISISFMEIKEIVKTKKGGFIIKGVDATDVIYIPSMIEDPQELEQRLKTLAPIQTKSIDPGYKKYLPFLFFPAIGLLICALVLTNKILVGVCGALFITLAIWGLVSLQKNKNLPTSAKRRSWVLIVILISFIWAIVEKLL